MDSPHLDRPDPDAVNLKMFVGQIPRSWDERDLRKLFEEFGPVYQIHLLRDPMTGQSKGCCFVIFYTRKAAVDAQNALHNSRTLPGMQHPIQMKPADVESRSERKLFVGMLSKKCTENDLRVMFAPFGIIEECTVLRDSNGNSKGCAFVTYGRRQCAVNAIKALNYSKTMDGCNSPLVVKFADTMRERDQKRQQRILTNFGNLQSLSSVGAFLQQAAQVGSFGGFSTVPHLTGNLNSLSMALAAAGSNASLNSLNLQGLTGQNSPLSALGLNPIVVQNLAALTAASGGNYFPGFGGMSTPANLTGRNCSTALNSCQSSSIRDTDGPSHMTGIPLFGGTSSGTSLESLTQAYTGLNQYSSLPGGSIGHIDFLSCMQNPLTKQVEGPAGANLFIYHLPVEFNDSDLGEAFAPFGNVISAKVFIDKQTNTSKCFGFVSYDNPISAQIAIQAMNGFQVGTKRLKVQLKRSKDAAKPY